MAINYYQGHKVDDLNLKLDQAKVGKVAFVECNQA